MKSRVRQTAEVVGSIVLVVVALIAAVFASALGLIEPKLDLEIDGWSAAPWDNRDDSYDGVVIGSFEITNTAGIAVDVVSFGGKALPTGWDQLTTPVDIGPLTLGPDESATFDVRFRVDCDTVADERWDPQITIEGIVPLNKTATFDLGRQPIGSFDPGTIEDRGDGNALMEEWHLKAARDQVCRSLQ